jgi:mRNA interferase MazF
MWWVALDPVVGSEIAKTRPCVVLTRDVVNQHRRTVVVIPLSSSPSASPPIRVAVSCEDRAAVAVVDQIRAVSKQRMQNRIGVVTGREMENIEDALRQILDLT